MLQNSIKFFFITISIFFITQTCNVVAQTGQEEEPVILQERRLSGPRMGLTYVCQNDPFNRNGKLIESLEEHDIGAIISLFGWHFEWLVTPEGGGPSFVTELIPFLGGVEYATVIPSISLVLGIRLPKGFEFGLGPNVMANFAKLIDDGENPLSSSLIVAIGYSINYSGVSIPLNLAVLTNNDGTRFSLVFGYALGKRRTKRNR